MGKSHLGSWVHTSKHLLIVVDQILDWVLFVEESARVSLDNKGEELHIRVSLLLAGLLLRLVSLFEIGIRESA